MKPLYTIERWPHGWVLCGNNGGGIPLSAMKECEKLFPKNAGIDSGICHHLKRSGHGHPHSVMVVVEAVGQAAWRAEIAESLNSVSLDPEQRWWRGVDVGSSSTAIFAVFCRTDLKYEAKEHGRGAVPHDAGDFGRCKRLLDFFPAWRAELHKVAEAYPDTKWPAIVARWTELEAADTKRQTEILRAIEVTK